MYKLPRNEQSPGGAEVQLISLAGCHLSSLDLYSNCLLVLSSSYYFSPLPSLNLLLLSHRFFATPLLCFSLSLSLSLSLSSSTSLFRYCAPLQETPVVTVCIAALVWKRAKPRSKNRQLFNNWREKERGKGSGGGEFWRWGKKKKHIDFYCSMLSQCLKFEGSFAWKLRCSGVLTAENNGWEDYKWGMRRGWMDFLRQGWSMQYFRWIHKLKKKKC